MASESGFGSHNPFRRKTAASPGAGAQAQPGAGAAPPPSSSVLHADTRAPAFAADDPLAPQAPPPRPSGTDFARSLTLLPKSDAPPPTTSFQKKKPVKKVRVQSPPPSSPESASAERSYPKYPLPPREEGDDSSVSSPSVNGEAEDPFQNEAPPLPEDALASMERVQVPQPQPYTGRGPPPNPFQKTLEDMEQAAKDGGSASAEHASPAGKGLDVEAFKKLLLTGQGPAPGAAGTSGSATLHPTGMAGDGGSMTDASSVSRQSIFENNNHSLESPRTSHEISEPEPEGDEEQRGLISSPPPKKSGSRKKLPPPPPATRHGRSIKVGPVGQDRPQALERRTSGGLADTSSGRRASLSPTDVNKPLPAPPERSEHDPKESIFDKEAAGKVPEVDIDPEADVVPPPRPPTPPNMSHSSSTPVQNPTSTLRKPAPPPRRGAHARTESKTQAELPEEPATPSRSSMESVRSRSSSIRLSTAAPAPPPPRRPAGHRQSPSISSPVANTQPSAFPFPAGQLSPSSDVPGPGSAHAPSQLATDTSSATTGSTTSLTPQQHPGVSKLSPPPPPQRNPSLRKSTAPAANRPTSSSSVEAPARKPGLPPPPPPRKRGSSRGSMEGSALEPKGAGAESVRKVSGDSFAGNVPPVAEEAEAVGVTGTDAAATDEGIQAMLADLDALQREVEAARAAAAGGGA